MGVVTLCHVSSRIHSEFGTLATPAERPVDPARHVWVTSASGRQAALLVAWVRAGDGTWWGKVAVSDAPVEASLQLVDGRMLSPVSTQTDGD